MAGPGCGLRIETVGIPFDLYQSGMNIALIAHDKKDDIVALDREFPDFLSSCHLVATGTTGGRLPAEVGLDVECMLSGPVGGDLQIGARLAVGQIDAMVFLRDPMTPQPHEPDIALVRACDVHNVPCATNLAGGTMASYGPVSLLKLASQVSGVSTSKPSGRARRLSLRTARSRLSSHRAPWVSARSMNF